MAQGLQDPVLSRPDAAPVGRGIQNKTADYVAAEPVQVVTADPPATVDNVGELLVVKTPGQPSLVKVCAETSTGGYEWIGIAQSS